MRRIVLVSLGAGAGTSTKTNSKVWVRRGFVNIVGSRLGALSWRCFWRAEARKRSSLTGWF